MANAEGYVSKPTKTDTRYTNDEVIGIGVNLTANPEWRAEFEAVRSPEEMAQVTGRFVKEHYKDWAEVSSSAGLPDANDQLSQYYKPAYIGLADAYWHGGKGGGVSYANILVKAKQDMASAIADLKGTAYYKQSGKSRRQVLELGLKSVR